MQLNDLLKVGEVIEVKGQKVKAGIYKDKNSTYLNYNGEIIKNIGIGGYIAIRKGFLNIVGKVEGEYIKEQETADDFEIKGNNINRIIEISILGSINNDKFTHGLVELPLIGNYIYVVEEKDLAKILSFGNGKKLTLGYLIDYPEFPFKVSLQDLICSHIGIFGNTGSGKSNTLARLYTEIFNLNKTNSKFHKNSEFIFMDFNGEYINTFPTAEIYTLSTRNIRNCNKYPLKMNEIFEVDFWAIVLEATDKTQKPFIKRTLSKFKSMRNEGFNFSKKDLASLVLNSQEHYFDLKYNLEEIFEIANLKDSFFHFEEEIKYNSKLRKFYTNEVSYNTYSQPNWEISFDMVYRALFKEEEIDETNLDLNLPTPFIEFRFMLNYYYCIEISKGYIAQHHIGPILARSSSKIEDLEKIFAVNGEETNNNIKIISLVNLNTQMKKLIPMVICKTKYDAKKQSKGKKAIDSSLHFIIDEAHNILSYMSTRESEEWKDYRLESFEEIIKEGRKFGTFLTIASQRPSDISDTIISQLHNYFIHRLVNEEDLRKIYKTVAFSDKASNEMISILPPGGCLFSGIATNFPVLAKINILSPELMPKSENVDLRQIWGIS